LLTLVCRLGELPGRLAVLGGGAVSCELAHQHEPERGSVARPGRGSPRPGRPAGCGRARRVAPGLGGQAPPGPARIGHEDQGAYFEIRRSPQLTLT
jgi:hypothetical protein